MTGRGHTGPPRALLALARAVAAGRRVRVAYRDGPGEVSEREVEVLALGFRWGGWVAACHALPRGALRLLAVERVLAARVGRRRAGVHRTPGFDAREFALADLLDPEAGPAVEVTLLLPPRLAPLAAALLSGAAAEVVRGGARVHLRVTSRPALLAMASSLGLRIDSRST
ncbi:MAG TPA: WYL domain-containing protein [Anaeromyxobacteraceae bacterium]|nr:WYL domain-containing protein [Anaeromyxobacteraceae bacterium]